MTAVHQEWERVAYPSQEPVWRVRVTWPNRYKQWVFVAADNLVDALARATRYLNHGGSFEEVTDLAAFRVAEDSYPGGIWVPDDEEGGD